jgi:hypothetical protein
MVRDTVGWVGWALLDAQCASDSTRWRNWGSRGRSVREAGFVEFALGGISHLDGDVTCPDIWAAPPADTLKVKPALNVDLPVGSFLCPDGRRY